MIMLPRRVPVLVALMVRASELATIGGGCVIGNGRFGGDNGSDAT